MRNYLKGLYIEIISRCNEKCIYCYNEKNMTDCVMLPYGKTADIISNAVKMGVENIAISGGEPFLHPEIKEIISIINENGLTPTIITNLTLLDVEMSEFLSGKKVNLQLTLDSGIEEIHDLSRGKGTFGKQVKAIGLLKNIDSAMIFYLGVISGKKIVPMKISYPSWILPGNMEFQQLISPWHIVQIPFALPRKVKERRKIL